MIERSQTEQVSLPSLIIAVDPDSVRTAVAVAKLSRRSARTFQLEQLEGGGGSRKPVPWSSISGIMPWLREQAQLADCGLASVVVVVETQAPNGPRSADVEALRRVRYHFDAACELLGCACVHVDKAAWQQVFVPGEMRSRQGEGAVKRAYQVRARELTAWADNEDKCAAVGVLSYYVGQTLRGKIIYE